jgi:hypothetical protein
MFTEGTYHIRECLKEGDEIRDAMVSMLLSNPVVHVPNAEAAIS